MHKLINKSIPLFFLLSISILPIFSLTHSPLQTAAVRSIAKYDPPAVLSSSLKTVHDCTDQVTNTFRTFLDQETPKAYPEYILDVDNILQTMREKAFVPLENAQNEKDKWLFNKTLNAIRYLYNGVRNISQILRRHSPDSNYDSTTVSGKIIAAQLLNELGDGKKQLKEMVQKVVLPELKKISTHIIESNPAQEEIDVIIKALTRLITLDSNAKFDLSRLIAGAQYRLSRC